MGNDIPPLTAGIIIVACLGYIGYLLITDLYHTTCVATEPSELAIVATCAAACVNELNHEEAAGNISFENAEHKRAAVRKTVHNFARGGGDNVLA